MELQKLGKVQKIADERRRTSDGYEYHAYKLRHESGRIVEINKDINPATDRPYHARIDGEHTAVNLSEGGLVAFVLRFFGRR